MPSETVENYLKAVHTLAAESPSGEAPMSRIAAMVGVTTGTATTMIKRLAAAKLARYERFGGVTLTPKGTRQALDVIRRHRLIEAFLVQTLRLDWSIVHAEAERLEHAVSPVVLEALDAHLGYPLSDPHGDPIPDRDGRLRSPEGKPLCDTAPGKTVRVTRILDDGAAFLRFVSTHGLRPGSAAKVIDADPAAGTLTIQAEGCKPVALAAEVAAKILVTPAASARS
jgi:DtxR family transcriptional regulator, Mn-dependent transcriptional regulator